MIFSPTALDGVMIVDIDPRTDHRGFFARSFCAEEFGEHELVLPSIQQNLSYTVLAGTVRGIHWQTGTHAEAKYTRCIAGAILDVAVDVDPTSPTYLRHVAVELSARNRRALYIAPGYGRAYQTLLPDTEVLYSVSAGYEPSAERGLRPTDPRIGIEWPIPITDMSEKDARWDLLPA